MCRSCFPPAQCFLPPCLQTPFPPCLPPPRPRLRLQVLQPIMPSTLFRIFTSVVRGLNNMVGGVSFVMIAKALGVQKAADAAPEPVPVPAPADKKKRK